MNILFCNIAYMQYYDVSSFKETPKHGGKYVEETGDAFEKLNFHTCEDGRVRGFVETKYVDGTISAKQPRQLRLESIDSQHKKSESIDNVTVIFCAHSDIKKKTIIVGWYKNATVYRYRPQYKGRQFNIECLAENAHLLSDAERDFVVPRATQDGFGFGQSNVWYAKDGRSTEYINSVFEYINTKSSCISPEEDSIPQVIPSKYNESGIGKKVLVNKYERNPIARRKCIEEHGASCFICGFNAGHVYGAEFEGKIEVHHIVPINEINSDYKVDPVNDLIPVCPNCHTMLHSKMSTGMCPTIDELKSFIAE